jgi:sugar-specific transcriptional regulator TrmB
MLIRHLAKFVFAEDTYLSLKENDVLVLTELGLTNSQAKVYLHLLKLGQATGKALSQQSKVARQEIYRILGELQEKGCVEKLIALPAEFKPVPIEEWLPMQIRQRRQKLVEAENRALQLADSLKDSKGQIQEKESFIMLVPEREAYLRKFRNSIANATKSVDMILHWECLIFGLTTDYKIWNQALDRGVKTRFIVFNASKEKSNEGTINEFKVRKGFQLRYTLYPPPATMTLWDGTEASISLSPNPKPHHASSLWSNNCGLIAVFQDYFETIWRNSYKETAAVIGNDWQRKLTLKALE